MSDLNVSQGLGPDNCGSREDQTAPATAALAPMSARERYARIIDLEAFEFKAWNDNWRAAMARRQSEALAKADAILADQAELIAQRAALVDGLKALKGTADSFCDCDGDTVAGEITVRIDALLASIQAGDAK